MTNTIKVEQEKIHQLFSSLKMEDIYLTLEKQKAIKKDLSEKIRKLKINKNCIIIVIDQLLVEFEQLTKSNFDFVILLDLFYEIIDIIPQNKGLSKQINKRLSKLLRIFFKNGQQKCNKIKIAKYFIHQIQEEIYNQLIETIFKIQFNSQQHLICFIFFKVLYYSNVIIFLIENDMYQKTSYHESDTYNPFYIAKKLLILFQNEIEYSPNQEMLLHIAFSYFFSKLYLLISQSHFNLSERILPSNKLIEIEFGILSSIINIIHEKVLLKTFDFFLQLISEQTLQNTLNISKIIQIFFISYLFLLIVDMKNFKKLMDNGFLKKLIELIKCNFGLLTQIMQKNIIMYNFDIENFFLVLTKNNFSQFSFYNLILKFLTILTQNILSIDIKLIIDLSLFFKQLLNEINLQEDQCFIKEIKQIANSLYKDLCFLNYLNQKEYEHYKLKKKLPKIFHQKRNKNEKQKQEPYQIMQYLLQQKLNPASETGFIIFLIYCENDWENIFLEKLLLTSNPVIFLHQDWLLKCHIFNYLNQNILPFLLKYSQTNIFNFQSLDIKSLANNFFAISDFLINQQSQIPQYSHQLLNIIINIIWQLINKNNGEIKCNIPNQIIIQFLKNLQRVLLHIQSKFKILQIDNQQAYKAIRILCQYFLSQNDLNNCDFIVDCLSILMCLCVKSERRFMILVFEILEQMLPFAKLNIRNQDFVKYEETQKHLLKTYSIYGIQLIQKVHLEMPNLNVQLEEDKERSYLFEQKGIYFLFLIQMFFKDKKEAKQQNDKYFYQYFNKIKTQNKNSSSTKISNEISRQLLQLKQLIFINTTDEEIKTYSKLTRRIFEIYLLDFNYAKGENNMIKEILPNYSQNPIDIKIRENIISNTFIIKLMSNIINGSESLFLFDLIITLLGNIISIYNDKEQKNKPLFTLKKIIKICSNKNIIHSRFKNLIPLLDKMSDITIRDISILIFNFITQFKMFANKNADQISTELLKNYNTNLKSLFLNEICKIGNQYYLLQDLFQPLV